MMETLQRDSRQKPPGPHIQPHKRTKMLVAKDVMTSPAVAVGVDSTVDEVCEIFVTRGIGAVLVVDQGVLLGIVNEEDLMRRAEIGTAPLKRSWLLRLFTNNATLAADYVKSHSVHVVDFMTLQVATVTESTPIVEIAVLLESNGIKRVAVVGDGGVIGIVSRANLVRVLAAARKSQAGPFRLHDDISIKREILDALRSESWPSIGDSDVTVTNGVVAFWGGYLSEQERKASLVLAENIAGVLAIDDHRIPLDITYAMV